jgi:hypothetical protein
MGMYEQFNSKSLPLPITRISIDTITFLNIVSLFYPHLFLVAWHAAVNDENNELYRQ